MSLTFRSSILILAAVFSTPTAAAALPPETPLIVEGDVKVEAADFEGALLRAPENRRAEVRASYDRVSTVVDSIFITRMVAEQARAAGLDKDLAVQKRLKQVQEAALAELYLRKLEKDTPMPDLEQRARELYRAEPQKFAMQERVHLQQILVGLHGRTRDMARDRARELYAEAQAGKADFPALVQRHSDDPEKARNLGRVGTGNPASLPPAIAEALKKMKPGDVSEPVETESGFHILRFVERQPARTLPFEDVKKAIMDAERDRILKKRLQDVAQQIRDSKTVVIHRANVEALVMPIDPQAFKKKLEESAAAAK